MDEEQRKKVGRPTLCTPEVIEKLTFALTKGCPVEHACGYAEITEASYYEWLEKAEAGDTNYLEFAEAIKKCEPQFIMNQLQIIEKASQREWTAAAWLSERRSPSNFSKNQTRLKIKQAAQNMSIENKILDMTNQILEQVAKGKLSLEDARAAAAMLEEQRKVVETVKAIERLDKLENQLKKMEND